MPIRQPNEDLFEETRMSFGEHLEELRRVLVRSLYGVGICCVVGFLLANQVVEFLQTPLKAAIGDFKIARAEEKLRKQNGGFLPPEISAKMESERLIPEVVQIDPAQIIEALRITNKDHMLDVDLTPYRFYKQEIRPGKIGELAARWIDGDEGSKDNRNDELSLYWSLLSEENRTELRALRNSELDEEVQAEKLLEILNQLIENPAINQSEIFADRLADPSVPFYKFWVSEPDDTLFQMKKNLDESRNPTDLSRRLNHVLVSKTFEDQLHPPHIPMARFQLWKSAEVNPQSLAAQEVFMIWMKAGLITGLFLSSPWLFYQIWSFVAAGLYQHEQRYVYIYLPFSLGLFFSGAALSFFFVFKPVLSFLFEFNAGMGIEPQPRIGDWLSFVLFLPLGFGIAFQLPLVMLALNRIGLIELQSYLNKWRVAILVIFVVSMLLTPADPISLILLACPLSLLYFLGIGLCRWMPKGRNPFGEEVYEP